MSNAILSPSPDPTFHLPAQAWYQLIHTLNKELPDPVADTPEAWAARNEAAIARVAAMLPVNADEAEIAAHCVAARAQAEQVMVDIRAHSGDFGQIIKLQAQYALMERTAIANRSLLLRVQTARHRREHVLKNCEADERMAYVAAREMQLATERGIPPAPPVREVLAPADPATRPEPADAAAVPPAAPPSLVWASPPAPALPPPQPEPVAAYAAGFGAPSRRPRPRGVWRDDDLPTRDLAAEAELYAQIHPRRARLIRQLGGLPADCSFGPPDKDLLRAIVTGTTPSLRELDETAAAIA